MAKTKAKRSKPVLHLFLLRHAKSAWDEEGLADAERPLAARGTAAAKAMGRAMAENDLLPDRVLVSTARRARDTWALVSAGWHPKPAAVFIPELYDFGDGSALLDVIRREGSQARRLMLVGHNPSLERLAERIVASGPRKLREAMAAKFPTGALAVIRSRLMAGRNFLKRQENFFSSCGRRSLTAPPARASFRLSFLASPPHIVQRSR